MRYAGGLVLLGGPCPSPIVCAARTSDALWKPASPIRPPEARLRCYWWWLNGNTTEAAITRDLEEMKAKGYGGALLVDANGSDQQHNRMVPAGPMFGTPDWRELYRHALKEADRLGLEISLNIESGWNLGGPSVKPEQAAKLLTWSRDHRRRVRPSFTRALAAPPQRQMDSIATSPCWRIRCATATRCPARPIRQLAIKSAAMEFGMSMPTRPLRCWKTFRRRPARRTRARRRRAAISRRT